MSLYPCLLFFSSEYFRLFREYFLPLSVAEDVFVLVGGVNIYCIVSVRPANVCLPGEAENLGALP